MITIKLMGGLGNQLFQICTAISYALDNGDEFIFLNEDTVKTGRERPTYWNNFLAGLQPYLTKEGAPSGSGLLRERGFRYRSLPSYRGTTLGNATIMLYGYFQSYKYLSQIQKIIELIRLEKMIAENPRPRDDEQLPVVVMHFRYDDYKPIQDYHHITPYDYYDKAMTQMQDKIGNSFVVMPFYQDVDKEDAEAGLNKLAEKYPTVSIMSHCSDEVPDWKQMLYMVQCDHHIISNSTFSWWGAYLCRALSHQDTTKHVVIYPDPWFGPKAGHDTRDLCPDDWIKIKY